VSPALANFLFEAVNFLLLAAVLGRILFKPVRRALDADRQRHAKEDEESKRLRAAAEKLAAEARAAREAADRETEEHRRQTLQAAQQEAAQLLAQARQEQAAERRALEQERTASRDAAAAALAETVGRIAAASVEQLLAALHGPPLDVALVRAACAEIEKLPSGARKSALVESAHPLDAEARGLLAAVLGEGFQERTVGELGAGVRVTTPAGQVDVTAVALARRAAQAVRAAAGASESAGGGDG
jgi:F-type H+-transporting ATPase subunit b